MEIDIPDTVWFESDEHVKEFGLVDGRPKRLCFTHAVRAVMLRDEHVAAGISSQTSWPSCDICYGDEKE